jgi:alpha-beta hydrolase superfamily lysophospholipase
MLVCNPFAAESVFAYRNLVELAREGARRGIAVVRFDYVGTGDSEGEFADAGIASRLSDIETAWQYLEGLPGLEQLGLFGLRFGATLAALAAARFMARPDLLILADPVVDAAAYFKQALRTNIASQTTTYRKVIRDRQALAERIQEGGLVSVVGGFPLGQRLQEEAASVSLEEELNAPAGAVLVTATAPEGSKTPPADAARLIEAYAHAGADVRFEPTPGPKIWDLPRSYFEAHRTLIDSVLDQMNRAAAHPGEGRDGSLPPRKGIDGSATPFARLETPFKLRSPTGNVLSGILHHPKGPPARHAGVLLVEVGVGTRIGMHRFNVRLARRLAELGYPVVRVDPGGVGNSEGSIGPMPLLTYYEAIEAGIFTEDLRAVLASARRATNMDDWYVFGHCGGAVASVLAFHSEPRIRGAVLTDMAFYPARRRPDLTQAKLASARSWIRALTFRTDYRYFLKKILARLRERLTSLLRRSSRREGPSRVAVDRHGLNATLVAGFRDIIRRQKEILLVFSAADHAIEDFRRLESRLTRPSALPRIPYRIEVIEDANHTFFLQPAQARLMESIADWFASDASRRPDAVPEPETSDLQ